MGVLPEQSRHGFVSRNPNKEKLSHLVGLKRKSKQMDDVLLLASTVRDKEKERALVLHVVVTQIVAPYAKSTAID